MACVACPAWDLCVRGVREMKADVNEISWNLVNFYLQKKIKCLLFCPAQTGRRQKNRHPVGVAVALSVYSVRSARSKTGAIFLILNLITVNFSPFCSISSRFWDKWKFHFFSIFWNFVFFFNFWVVIIVNVCDHKFSPVSLYL